MLAATALFLAGLAGAVCGAVGAAWQSARPAQWHRPLTGQEITNWAVWVVGSLPALNDSV
jgi:hypothetical protein